MTQASHYPYPTNCDEIPKRKTQRLQTVLLALHFPVFYTLQSIGVMFRVWASYNATDGENCRAQAIMKSFDQKTLIQVCEETRRDGNIARAIQ